MADVPPPGEYAFVSREVEPSLEERLERRQKHVAALIRLDAMMDDRWGGKATKEGMLATIESLPDSLKKGAEEVIDEHLERKERALETWGEIVRVARQKGYTQNAEALGAFLFIHRTGERPSGEVRLERSGPSFIMTLADPTDYRLFYGPIPGRADGTEDHSGSYHTLLSKAENPSEAYKRITMNGELNFVLLVKASLRDPEHRKIVVHEHQHHVNHAMLKLFERSERGEQKSGAVDSAITRPVKDEVLAYMREEASGTFLEENIFSPLYTHLFNEHPEEIRLELEGAVRTIAHSLDADKDVWDRFGARDALVFHLIDIPFQEIPAQMKRLAEFYRPHLQAVARPFPRTIATLNSMEIFRTLPEQQGIYEKMRNRTFDLTDKAYAAIRAVFTQPADMRIKERRELEAMRMEYDESWTAFQEGDVRRVFGFVRPEGEAADRLLNELLTRLSVLPRELLARFSVDRSDRDAARAVVEKIDETLAGMNVHAITIGERQSRSGAREIEVDMRLAKHAPSIHIILFLEPPVEDFDPAR